MELVIDGVLAIQAGANPRVVATKLRSKMHAARPRRRQGGGVNGRSHPARAHARRGGHEEEHEEHENHERWLVSYADMMTLLMVLFIVMFAISSMNQGKFDELKTGPAHGLRLPPDDHRRRPDSLLDSGGAVAPDAPPVNDVTQGGTAARRCSSLSRPAPSSDPGRVRQRHPAGPGKQEVDNLKSAEGALKAALARAGVPTGRHLPVRRARSGRHRRDRQGALQERQRAAAPAGPRHPRRAGTHAREAPEPAEHRRPHQLAADLHRPLPLELGAVDRPGHRRPALPGPPRGTSREPDAGDRLADTNPLLPPTDPRALVVNRRVEIVVLAAVDGRRPAPRATRATARRRRRRPRRPAVTETDGREQRTARNCATKAEGQVADEDRNRGGHGRGGGRGQGRGKLKLIIARGRPSLALAAGRTSSCSRPKGAKPAPPKPTPGAVVKLDPITVNLAGGHFLKLGLSLQASADAGEDVSGAKALDAAIEQFTGKRDDLATGRPRPRQGRTGEDRGGAVRGQGLRPLLHRLRHAVTRGAQGSPPSRRCRLRGVLRSGDSVLPAPPR